MDERWRIVIPSKFRQGLKPKDKLIVERRGNEIVLRKLSAKDILEEFRKIKFYVTEKRNTIDAEKVSISMEEERHENNRC